MLAVRFVHRQKVNGFEMRKKPKTKKMSKPTLENIKEYMKGHDEFIIRRFYEKYLAQGWIIGGHEIKNWKLLADEWFKNLTVNKKMGEL